MAVGTSTGQVNMFQLETSLLVTVSEACISQEYPLVCSLCDQTLEALFGQRGEGTQIAVLGQDLEILLLAPMVV